METDLKRIAKSKDKANDRAYTVEEIHKLVEHSDRRMKAIVYTMYSSGIRAGAWTYLRWKHVKPIIDDKTGNIIAAKLTVYADEPEQNYTFITPKAYSALENYIKYQRSAGEEITGDSWLVRDSWKTTDVKYGAKASLATNPKPLKAHTIEKLLGRALRAQNVRSPLTKGVRRHEYKATHGLRKFFDNAADSAGMKYLHIEYLMGHDIGITGNYRRFQEQKLLNDYLKAVAFLTISSQKTTQLQQQVAQLTVKNEEQKYVIERKLAEKEKESQETKKALEEIKAKHEDTKKELQQLIDNRQEQFEKYMTDILEARLKLVSPAYVYSSDKAFRKAVKKQVLEKDDKIKRSLRSTNNNAPIE